MEADHQHQAATSPCTENNVDDAVHHNKVIVRFHPIHLTNVQQHHACVWPSWLGCKAAIIYTHHHHLPLLSPKAGTHLTIAEKVECRVNHIGLVT